MKTKIYSLASLLLIVPAVNSFAAAELSSTEDPAPSQARQSAVVQEVKNHFSLYGFIRNYFAFDSRESASGTGNLFYYLPFDKDLNSKGEDLNAQPSFRFLSITSRVGLDVSGYKVGNMDISAKVETDFYAGLSGSTGTATMRLRQAYMKLGWKDLPMGRNSASVSLLMGQAWHPLAADQPDVISLATGAPFNPFNRSPQVTMDASLGKHFTITGSLVYQMQYTSSGPAGSTADYMKYGILPEIYAGVSYKTGGFLVKGGVSLLSIKPLNTFQVSGEDVKVSGRMTALSPFLYAQYKYKTITVKAKTVYGSAADYVNQVSGYGITGYDAAALSLDYAATHSSSSWLSVSAGKKLQGMLMVGYISNLGASKDFIGMDSYYFFKKDGYDFRYMAQAYRIVPTVAYNLGKFTVGLEYELTSAQYGDQLGKNGSVLKNGATVDSVAGIIASRHWVTNHRIQLMTKFTF